MTTQETTADTETPLRSAGRTTMTADTEFQRGWDAAMNQAESRIRDAERSRDSAFTTLAHVHSLAKHLAELSRPAFDLEVWRREHDTTAAIRMVGDLAAVAENLRGRDDDAR